MCGNTNGNISKSPLNAGRAACKILKRLPLSATSPPPPPQLGSVGKPRSYRPPSLLQPSLSLQPQEAELSWVISSFDFPHSVCFLRRRSRRRSTTSQSLSLSRTNERTPRAVDPDPVSYTTTYTHYTHTDRVSLPLLLVFQHHPQTDRQREERGGTAYTHTLLIHAGGVLVLTVLVRTTSPPPPPHPQSPEKLLCCG